MFNSELNSLVELALADGEITDKERQVLMRKADSMGVDLDEFEMVLDAKLYQLKQTMAAHAEPPPAPTQQQASSEVIKCPRCHTVMPSFTTTCDCGHEFRGTEAAASISRLFEMLNESEESELANQKGQSVVMMFSKKMLGESANENIVKRKMEIISTFPIPNTKEDIVEFLALALPQTQMIGNRITRNNTDNKPHNDMAMVWKNKCEQIVMKSKFAFKSDPETLNEILDYAKKIGINA